MARTKKADTAVAADPLADLRDEGDRYPSTAPVADPPGVVSGAVAVPDTALASAITAAAAGVVAADTDEARAEAIAGLVEVAQTHVSPPIDTASMIDRWHADQVALGFLHGGGVCGCTYLARIAVGG